MVRKIQAYENNNIFQGERLILTFETEQTILNTGKIAQLVKNIYYKVFFVYKIYLYYVKTLYIAACIQTHKKI